MDAPESYMYVYVEYNVSGGYMVPGVLESHSLKFPTLNQLQAFNGRIIFSNRVEVGPPPKRHNFSATPNTPILRRQEGRQVLSSYPRQPCASS